MYATFIFRIPVQGHGYAKVVEYQIRTTSEGKARTKALGFANRLAQNGVIVGTPILVGVIEG